jgi:hypothetical protein
MVVPGSSIAAKEIAAAALEKTAGGIPEFKKLDIGKEGLSPQQKELSPLKNEIPKFSNYESPIDSDGVKEQAQKGQEIPAFRDTQPQDIEKSAPESTKDVPERTFTANPESEVSPEKVEANGKDVVEAINEANPKNTSPQNDIDGIAKNETGEVLEKLTDEDKLRIKEEQGWSDEIIDAIDSMEQYEKVYANADLVEAEINERKCLIKRDLDLDYVDPKTGMTNRELMEKGRSPIDPKTGEKIELHHMGQKADAPFAELTENTEHGGQNHGTLHPRRSDSWRNVEGAKENYAAEKTNHWKTRAQEGQGIAA